MKGRRSYSTVLIAAILLVFNSVGLFAQTPEIESAMTVQEANTPILISIPGVVGTAVGLDSAGQPVIQVLVSKIVRGLLERIPDLISGIPVTVKVTGEIVAHRDISSILGNLTVVNATVNPASRFPRPVPIGVSTGHPNITAGTIGAKVKDDSGNIYALSNNHVYADQNRASIGDNVLQPGAFDGGVNPGDKIGVLADFETISFCFLFNLICPLNQIDAAIALSSEAELGNTTPLDGYGSPETETVFPAVNQDVMKYGRTTSFTRGRITGVNATVNVQYGLRVARFSGQIIIEPGGFSAGGDSGSLIVLDDLGADDRKPVGLLFAGSSTVTIANPINSVLSTFGVTIDGE